jgi:ADP-ribose pyrophosphatase YjhB (NUDIX family)
MAMQHTSPHFTHRAAGIVVYEGHILLMRRVRDGQSFWVVPGGTIEISESPEQTAVRELLEETDIQVRAERVVYQQHFERPNHTSFDQWYVLCTYLKGEPRLPTTAEESVRAQRTGQVFEPKWVPITQVAHLHLLPEQIKEWLCHDFKHGFDTQLRSATLRQQES